MIIAIDGPAGAGKSTITRLLARRLGFVRIDTGALYRAVALAATRRGLDGASPEALGALVRGLDLRLTEDHVFLEGEDVSQAIRTPEVSLAASRVAAVPEVRAGLLELQRRLGRATDSVMDGRDIGTVVFPDADVKIFLTASAAERARRRHAELAERGTPAAYDDVLREIEQRDHQDMNRDVAPLRQAEDAVIVDATDLTIDGAVAACEAVVRQRRSQRPAPRT